jgi:hypothetical protein
MKARIEPKKWIKKKLTDEFAKRFYFQSGGFKNLGSEVF